MIVLPASMGIIRPGGGGGGSWAIAKAWTPVAGVSAGWNGYTLRQIIRTPALLAGSKLRITVAPGGTAFGLAKCYIQTAASNSTPPLYAFSGTPVQVLFAGSPGISLPSGGSPVVSDDIALAISAAQNLVVSMYFNATTSVVGANSVSDWSSHYLAGDDAATVSASGYTNEATGIARVVTTLEVFQP